jgi:sec-independent protein translocase protein TatA
MIPLYVPGSGEIILVVVVVLILFGGKKIPEMMKGMGSGIREFKKGLREDDPPPPNHNLPDDQKPKDK